jgi:hypothetical protein
MTSAFLLLGGGALLGNRFRTLTEAVLEAAGQGLEVPHATGARGATTDGLDGPVVVSLAGAGVAARATGGLLDVVGSASTPVGLGGRREGGWRSDGGRGT